VAKETFDAVILIAHGARDDRWPEPFVRLRAELGARLPGQKIVLSYMEFIPPSFGDAVSEVCRAGARRILVVPIFLSSGGHVAKDIRELVAAERERQPEATFVVSGAVGEEPEVARAMIEAVTRLAVG
jgi:sirohydrochlorin cobaltochelatase